jgi:hypothetical protein
MVEQRAPSRLTDEQLLQAMANWGVTLTRVKSGVCSTSKVVLTGVRQYVYNADVSIFQLLWLKHQGHITELFSHGNVAKYEISDAGLALVGRPGDNYTAPVLIPERSLTRNEARI